MNKLNAIFRRRGIQHLLPAFADRGFTDWNLNDLSNEDLINLGIQDAPLRKSLLAAFERVSSSRGAVDKMVKIQGGVLRHDSELWGTKFKAFWIGAYAVTMGEWERVRSWAVGRNFDMAAGSAPGRFHPVTNINWYDMLKWCNAKSLMEGMQPVYYVKGDRDHYALGEFGKDGAENLIRRPQANGYRLLMDPEWEWAARGGRKSKGFKFSGSNYLKSVAWYDADSLQSANLVGGKMPNELGLYDMNGNVFALCFDLNNGCARARGGSWRDPRYDCDLWDRSISWDPSYRADNVGLRLARNA